MKIRIGNDIRIDVTLINKSGSDNINIKYVKAYVINTSKEKEAEESLKNKTKFINRFPLEPYIDAYSSTAYDIRSTGFPTYRAYPQDHVFSPYSGFGINPHWDDIYKKIPKHNLTQYQAKVKPTIYPDTVSVFFPAESQLFTGDYKLVIQAKLYEPGFSDNDLRTVTMDYEDVFTLVNTSEEGVDGEVTIEVGPDHGRRDDILVDDWYEGA